MARNFGCELSWACGNIPKRPADRVTYTGTKPGSRMQNTAGSDFDCWPVAQHLHLSPPLNSHTWWNGMQGGGGGGAGGAEGCGPGIGHTPASVLFNAERVLKSTGVRERDVDSVTISKGRGFRGKRGGQGRGRQQPVTTSSFKHSLVGSFIGFEKEFLCRWSVCDGPQIELATAFHVFVSRVRRCCSRSLAQRILKESLQHWRQSTE